MTSYDKTALMFSILRDIMYTDTGILYVSFDLNSPYGWAINDAAKKDYILYENSYKVDMTHNSQLKLTVLPLGVMMTEMYKL